MELHWSNVTTIECVNLAFIVLSTEVWWIIAKVLNCARCRYSSLCPATVKAPVSNMSGKYKTQVLLWQFSPIWTHLQNSPSVSPVVLPLVSFQKQIIFLTLTHLHTETQTAASIVVIVFFINSRCVILQSFPKKDKRGTFESRKKTPDMKVCPLE